MMESDWRNAKDPTPMLSFLRDSGRASERKLKLFACGCGRRYCYYWDDIPEKPLIDRHCREFIDAAERATDDVSASAEVEAAWRAIVPQLGEGVPWPLGLQWGLHAVMRGNWGYWTRLYEETARTAREEASMDKAELLKGYAERGFQADLLRDLFGPLPFREARLDLAWLAWNDGTVKRLAEGIYDERRFQDMGVLGDALEEAGCMDEEVLAHLRSPGFHTRGCWVTDLLLGKE
jgi:hypothetical protein